MAFIKEESEDIRIEETFRVKQEDTEEQTDLYIKLLKQVAKHLNYYFLKYALQMELCEPGVMCVRMNGQSSEERA
ncbi:hypothetical protein QQF64_033929, partial [Cirrhinus molitorella]